MKLNKLNLAFLIILIYIVIGPSIYVLGNPQLGIRLNTEMTYKVVAFDIESLELLGDEDPSGYDFYQYFGIGHQFKYSVIKTFENVTYWKVDMDVLTGINLEDDFGTISRYVLKSPDLIPSFFIRNSTHSSTFGHLRPYWSLEPMIIPIDSQFLLSYNQSVPILYHNITYSTQSSIIFNFTSLEHHDIIIYKYNEIGSVSSFEIYYYDTLAYNLQLQNYFLGIDYVLILLVIIISSSIVLVIFEMYLILKRRKLKK